MTHNCMEILIFLLLVLTIFPFRGTGGYPRMQTQFSCIRDNNTRECISLRDGRRDSDNSGFQTFICLSRVQCKGNTLALVHGGAIIKLACAMGTSLTESVFITFELIFPTCKISKSECTSILTKLRIKNRN